MGNQAIHELDIARWGLGARFPMHMPALSGHLLAQDDQETRNTLHATFCFERDSKRKMMELEVRHWITNHEAEIGTGAYGTGGVPAAGLNVAASTANKKSFDNSTSKPQSLDPKDAK